MKPPTLPSGLGEISVPPEFTVSNTVKLPTLPSDPGKINVPREFTVNLATVAAAETATPATAPTKIEIVSKSILVVVAGILCESLCRLCSA